MELIRNAHLHANSAQGQGPASQVQKSRHLDWV